MTALQRWVEQGAWPDRFTATKYQQDQVGGSVLAQRPICAYPQFPKYTGTGDANHAANFTCVDNGNWAQPALNPANGYTN